MPGIHPYSACARSRMLVTSHRRGLLFVGRDDCKVSKISSRDARCSAASRHQCWRNGWHNDCPSLACGAQVRCWYTFCSPAIRTCWTSFDSSASARVWLSAHISASLYAAAPWPTIRCTTRAVARRSNCWAFEAPNIGCFLVRLPGGCKLAGYMLRRATGGSIGQATEL